VLVALLIGSAVLQAPRTEEAAATAAAPATARPSPLSAAEEADPATAALARRFNPAMALPTSDGPWPVPVSYTWSEGAPLMARTVGPGGRTLREEVARPAASLDRTSWDALPVRDRDDNLIQYWIDGPGDDRLDPIGATGDARTEWRSRFRALAGDDPAHSRFPATQYAHLFWIDRQQGLLAIQYWFFFPFNEWINDHEGDWEHITVVLSGPSHIGAGAVFHPVRHQFFFHGWRYEPTEVVHASGDHVVVFTGGRGRLLGWGGTQSGGSYPLPARFAGAGGGVGPVRVDDDARRPARYLPPESFHVVVLPEPARLDARAHPELSWLRLPFYAGQPHVRRNPPLIDRLGGGAPPLQPGLRAEWISAAAHPLWRGQPVVDPKALRTPNARLTASAD
jgi:hypothetical protein